MRHAFRAFGLCALCLALVPFFHVPAHAADGKTYATAAPVSKQTPAKTADASRQAPKFNPKAGQHPGGEDAAAAQPHDGWIKLESGSRQAYVGIHGGTAPLSLMRSSDGVLFAFTGQTGNDFLHVLKGGNASRQAADHSGQNAPVPGQKKEPDAKHAASASQEAKRHQENAGKPSASPSASPAVSAGTSAQSAPGSKTGPSPSADKTVSAGAPVPAAKSAPARANPADAGQPPAKGEVLVFASGDAKDASEGYKPFGLTPPAGMSPEDLRRQNAGLPPGGTPFLGKPLRLGSYQAILNSGKV